MKVLIFDTETTGFLPGNICQLAYVIKNNENIQARNYYFKVDYIEYGAQRVHRLTVKALETLSENKRFAEHHQKIKEDFYGADRWIAHNFDFDIKFLGAEFMNCGQNIPYNRGFCTMKRFTPVCKLPGKRSGYKYPSLEELVCFFGISADEVLRQTKIIFGDAGIGFHDARYDTVATYLCYQKASELGYCR